MKRNASSFDLRGTLTKSRAFSLVELLIVVVIVSVVAAVLVAKSDATNSQQLASAAKIIAAEIEYARDLAISKGSTYKVSFDLTGNRYVLTHTGTNTALDLLPESIYENPLGSPTERVQAIADLPGVGHATKVEQLELLAADSASYPSTSTSNEIEFTPLGATTETANTVIWLRAGSGGNERYISVTVNAASGLVSVGSLQTGGPTENVAEAGTAYEGGANLP